MIDENDRTPRGRLTEGRIPVLPDAQVTIAYQKYVGAFNKAMEYFEETFLDKPYPKQLKEAERYSGYQFEDFMPVYGYGLSTQGTISLNDVDYGQYKSFGVFGQHGFNLKEKYLAINRMQEIDRQIGKGEFDTKEEREDLEFEKEFILLALELYSQEGGMTIDNNQCANSYTLLSLTPNTLDDGLWNARGSVSSLTIDIMAEGRDSTRPLTPSVLIYPGEQMKIDSYSVGPPGADTLDEGALYVKAASAAVLSMAALTLF